MKIVSHSKIPLLNGLSSEQSEFWNMIAWVGAVQGPLYKHIRG